MEPTAEYNASPEVGRRRLTCANGAIHVVVECYSTAEDVFGKVIVYLSTDSGRHFLPVGWRINWRSALRKLAQEWPPRHVESISIAGEHLLIEYCEVTYDGPIDRRAAFLISEERWQLT